MQPIRRIRHCRCCGSTVEYRTPLDDNRPRAVCTVCGEVHYENPLNIVGTIPTLADRVLLCRRAIEPRLGLWTLPAGFMELGETTAEGALRETQEEAGAHIALQGLFALMNLASVGQVHLFYRAELLDTCFDPGPETLEVALYREDEIPWDALAFRTVRTALKQYFNDYRQGRFDLHCVDIETDSRWAQDPLDLHDHHDGP